MGKTRRLNKNKKKTSYRKSRRVRRGGNKTDGDKLMDALYENSQIPTSKPKKHSVDTIAHMFNKVKENDLYYSISRKKKTLTSDEKKAMFKEANIHQEDPSKIETIPECKYRTNCTRAHPVHKLVHSTRLYHPASLVAFSMIDKKF